MVLHGLILVACKNKSTMHSRASPPHNRIFVSLDFEAFTSRTWWNVTFVIAEYPSGRILEHYLFACHRGVLSDIAEHEHTKAFWTRFPDAFQANYRAGQGHEPHVVEERICVFVDQLKQRIPSFFLVSDAPAFDIRLLDDILLRHNRPPISQRNDGTYRQTFDTWSYSIALSHVFNCPTSKLYQRSVAGNRPVDRVAGLRHTSAYDAVHGLSKFFRLLDLAHGDRKANRDDDTEPNLPSPVHSVEVTH